MEDNKLVYSTNSLEHDFNMGDIESFEPIDNNSSDVIADDKLCRCGEFEIYSETLTNGLCLNCYHQLEEDLRWMEIEARHDYEEGLV